MEEIIVEVEEKQLENRAEIVKRQASEIKVVDEETFNQATEFTKKIKETIKSVEAYWKEPKQKAHEAHKAITAKESEMKKPLEEAEKMLKKELAIYVQIQEDEKRKAEEEARKACGGEFDIILESNVPQSKGVSFSTDYEVSVEDISKVPLMVNGVQILQVDLSAIKQLVKLAKGKIEIPGIKIEETKKVSIRS